MQRGALPTVPGAAGADEDPFGPTHRDPRQRYHVLGEHGRGGLGRVSRAHDRDLHRDVAIKELLARTSVNELRFRREALITARLEHPSIVPVHEAGRWDDGTPFYAMKLVSGRPLRELIAERPTVEARIGLLHHVIAVADAMAYAHNRNIIHRDLKPANIIVGDFGETIVIDWGLAKDLTITEESTSDDQLQGSNREDDLTATGSVLGTPAYMAPEQERGEHVDQRVDVFAIGAMLWEISALERVPPTDSRLRHRILSRAGIDKDLATIIDNALAPDPKHRYPSAGALAADLRAFKSGARIAARDYSLPALLAHWIRRHRALALSVTTAVALAAAGVAFHIHDIASERDRADAARVEAEAQRRNAENGRSELIIQHSKLLLHSDPTAAVAALASYHGDDEVNRRRLLAEAQGRGIASAVLSPHSDTIWFLVGEENGAFVSLGEDRKIRRTQGAQIATLAADVSTNVLFDYAPAKRLLAYVTSPPGIAVLDLSTLASTRLATTAPNALAIAPDGSSIAALDAHGMLTVWSLTSGLPTRQESIPGTIDLKFATPNRLVASKRSALRVITLDGSPGASLIVSSPLRALDTREDQLLVGDEAGNVALLSSKLEVITRLPLCRKRISSIRFVGEKNLATFACNDGIFGMLYLDSRTRSMSAFDVFTTLGPAIDATPDASGHWVVARSDSNVVYVYDITTRLVHQYEGQAARVSFTAPPLPGFNNILVGDVNGTVRVWALPSAASHKILGISSAIFDLAFIPDGVSLAVGGVDGIVRLIDISNNGITELRGHTGMVTQILAAPDGGSIASLSTDQSARLWSTSDGALIRTFTEHRADVGDASYVDNGRRMVSAGADGRLMMWSTDGIDETLLFQSSTPLANLEVLRYNNHVVVQSANGSVWDITSPGVARLVRVPDDATVTLLRSSQDGRLLAIGTDGGKVSVYNTVQLDDPLDDYSDRGDPADRFRPERARPRDCVGGRTRAHRYAGRQARTIVARRSLRSSRHRVFS
jgi:WD40 repeat protein